MNTAQKDFAFCTLALGQKYHQLTQTLAQEIQQYSPGTYFVVLTDNPQFFGNNSNVLAFKHHQRGILKCYHDRRFVLEKALSKFRVAIHIDSDSTILGEIPDIEWLPGLTSGAYRNILEHSQNQINPHRKQLIQNLGQKLGVSLENANHVEESLFVIARDNGKEIEFIKQWDKIGRYLEMNGVHEGDGNAIGLAAAKVGWKIQETGWHTLKKVVEHRGITWNKAPTKNESSSSNQNSRIVSHFWDRQKQRIGYHYRLNRDRLIGLTDINFYYK